MGNIQANPYQLIATLKFSFHGRSCSSQGDQGSPELFIKDTHFHILHQGQRPWHSLSSLPPLLMYLQNCDGNLLKNVITHMDLPLVKPFGTPVLSHRWQRGRSQKSHLPTTYLLAPMRKFLLWEILLFFKVTRHDNKQFTCKNSITQYEILLFLSIKYFLSKKKYDFDDISTICIVRQKLRKDFQQS